MAFRGWLEHGGGFVGIHATGGDFKYSWNWYRDTLIGAQFVGHTMAPQFQDAEVVVKQPSELTAHIQAPWQIAQEEWYAFDENPANNDSEKLLIVDESSYTPVR